MNSSSVRMSPTLLSLAPLLLVLAYACGSLEDEAPELLPNQSVLQDSQGPSLPRGHELRGHLATR